LSTKGTNGAHRDADDSLSLYNVKLEIFEGPLDLLLYLIKKNELDIYDIPIAVITKQYLEYIRLMKDLSLDIAGDFLVMASTLLQIKSNMLLPAREDDTSEQEVEDPRAELIRRLVEYSRYKEAAQHLNGRSLLGRELFARTFPSQELHVTETVVEAPEIELFELIEAFRTILAKAPREAFHEVSAESISIAERINEILSLIQTKDCIAFEELFENSLDRSYLVTTFLALLELCKLRVIRVQQPEPHGPIRIRPAVNEMQSAPDKGEGSDNTTP
jgi:segregation and condensation protein A